MDTLKSIHVFQAVAQSRSFSSAAKSLHITPVMATRYIKHIENHVGARLLNRTSRKVSLTEAGEMYLSRINPLVEGMAEAAALASESTLSPKGVLKIKMPAMMSTPIFSRLIASYRLQYPDVTLNFVFSSQLNSIVEESFDLVLHVGNVSAEGLVARKLANVHSCLVATPSLLDQFGRPDSLDKLKELPFLAHSRFCFGNKIRWKTNWNGYANREAQVRPVLYSENEMMILHTAIESVGVTILPEWLVAPYVQQGQLEAILLDEVRPVLPFYALFQDRNFLPAKTRSFLDFMVSFKSDSASAFDVKSVLLSTQSGN